MIAKALHTVGDGGIVTVEEAAEPGMNVQFVEGFEFDNGYMSPYMVTNPASLEAVVDDPYILLCAEKITQVQQLMPMLDKVMKAPRPLVIIAENLEGTALSMLVHNHVNGIFQCVAVRAPGFGDRRLHKLEDIAAFTGGAVLSKHAGFTPGDDDGRAARPAPSRSASPPTARPSSAAPTADKVEFRVTQLRAELGPRDVRHRRGRPHRAHRLAVGQGRGDQRRRADQRRAQGAAAPRRGRAVGHPRRDGGGCRRRWRRRR